MTNNKKTNDETTKKVKTETASIVHKDNRLTESVIDADTTKVRYATWNEGKINLSFEVKDDAGLNCTPLSGKDPILRLGIVKLPSNCCAYKNHEELVAEIGKFVSRFVDVKPSELILCTYYIMLTWVFDAFNELPYLRARGDFGTGKTRFLTVIGSLCYKSITTSGASTVAPLFHMIHRVRGTLVLDEADFRYSSETADITKILNNGNARGFPVLRCQKTTKGKFETVAYDVYGPKVIASRGDYDDEALESRCISIEMRSIRKDSSIPVTLPEDFANEALTLRNKLLSYRFSAFHDLRSRVAGRNSGLSARANQMYAPLLEIVRSDEDRIAILNIAHTAQEQMLRDRGMKVEAEMLTVIRRHQSHSDRPLSMKVLADLFRKTYGRYYERPISPKWVGSVVRKKLRLSTRKLNGRYIIAENQVEKLNALYDRYDVDVPKNA